MNEHQPLTRYKNNLRVYQNPDYYRQRQQITEHQFGTIKRHLGYDHTNLRGKPKLMGELGLLFTVYNLVRCTRIFGAEKLINTLLQRFYVNLSRKYGAFSAFLRKDSRWHSCKETAVQV